MTVKRSSPIRYHGSKTRLAGWIMSFFPKHDHYCEPFFGSGAVLFKKPRSRIETVNDLSGEVVNFFKVLRDDPDSLIHAIRFTPYAYDEYVAAFDEQDDMNPVERARRFYVRVQMGYQASPTRRSGWRYLTNTNSRSGERLTNEFRDMTLLWSAAERLKSVQIDNRPALEVIRRYDTAETLFYIDPPYVTSTRSDNREAYDHEMDDSEHADLVGVLNEIQGYAIVSGYECELYDRMLDGWVKHVATNRTNGLSYECECVWLSPRAAEDSVLPLFR